MNLRFCLVLATAVATLILHACSHQDASTGAAGDQSEPFEWTVLTNIDPTALGLVGDNIELFAPDRRTVMLADAIAVEEIERKFPDLAGRLDRYFRQFIGVNDNGAIAILVNYIMADATGGAAEARSAIQYWYNTAPSETNPPSSWIQVLVVLKTQEPSILHEHL